MFGIVIVGITLPAIKSIVVIVWRLSGVFVMESCFLLLLAVGVRAGRVGALTVRVSFILVHPITFSFLSARAFFVTVGFRSLLLAWLTDFALCVLFRLVSLLFFDFAG